MLVGKSTERNLRILHTLHAIFHILMELLARVIPMKRHSIMETLLIRCYVLCVLEYLGKFLQMQRGKW